LPGVSAKFWHATCDKNGMARKINALRTPPGNRGAAVAENRPPTPSAGVPHPAQLRPHPSKVPPSRPRLQIAIEIEEPPERPQVVKIIHTGSI
jgi:hypothetical protein